MSRKAFQAIAEGLEDAIAFSKGAKTRGRVRKVRAGDVDVATTGSVPRAVRRCVQGQSRDGPKLGTRTPYAGWSSAGSADRDRKIPPRGSARHLAGTKQRQGSGLAAAHAMADRPVDVAG